MKDSILKKWILMFGFIILVVFLTSAEANQGVLNINFSLKTMQTGLKEVNQEREQFAGEVGKLSNVASSLQNSVSFFQLDGSK